MSNFSRRLPVYLLLDCSGSMMGEPIEAVKQGIKVLVFILTDGSPTDTEDFKNAVKKIQSVKTANIIACAAGSNAKTEYLKQITNNVLMMNNLSAGDLSKFFAWVSSSVKISSQKINEKPDDAIQLPPPPQGFVIVP